MRQGPVKTVLALERIEVRFNSKQTLAERLPQRFQPSNNVGEGVGSTERQGAVTCLP
jgi:hypothetical protein